jgi:hypothetical protein
MEFRRDYRAELEYAWEHASAQWWSLLIGVAAGVGTDVAKAWIGGHAPEFWGSAISGLIGAVVVGSGFLCKHLWDAPAALAIEDRKCLEDAYAKLVTENTDLKRRLPSPAYMALTEQVGAAQNMLLENHTTPEALAEWKRAMPMFNFLMLQALQPLLLTHELQELDVIEFQRSGLRPGDADEEQSDIKAALEVRIKKLQALARAYAPSR